MIKYFLHNFTESSVLDKCLWNDQSQDLLVIFNSGAVWIYRNVPQIIYNQFVESSSAGKFFNQNIRDTFISVCLFKEGSSVVQA